MATDVEMGKKQDEVRLIPHTPEYEKKFGAYWIGTCFDRGDVPERWRIPVDVTNMPYLAHIKKLSASWPTLVQLVDFMEVGTTPLQWPFMKEKERDERISRTQVTFIEYDPADKPQSTQLAAAEDLAQKLATLPQDDSTTPPLRLFIVEDLSRRVIELLGNEFDIDPLFFREHIADYVWHNTRDPWAMPSSLLASKRQRSWFQLRNVRLRYHHNEDDFELTRQEANMWNVLRRPDNDNNHWHYKDAHRDEEKAELKVYEVPGTNVVLKEKEEKKEKKGKTSKKAKVKSLGANGNEVKPDKATVSTLRTRTTIWIGKDKKRGNGTVGVILLDPTVKRGTPLWYDRTNWLPTPTSVQGDHETGTNNTASSPSSDSTNRTKSASVAHTRSWYDDIVQMTAAYPWFEAMEGHSIQPQVLAYPTLYTIAAEWLVVCDYVKTRLSQIEWEIEMPALFRSKGDAIDSSLKRLHTWRRQIPVFRDMVSESIEQALPAAVRLTTAGISKKTTHQALEDDVKPDFQRILGLLEELQSRADRLTDIVVSEISIEDSKLSLEENHNLARLTWLATTFIPLSFVSAFFSMSEDVTALKYTYGWFFLAAIPFTGICLLIAQLAGGGALGRKTMKKEWLEKGSSFYEKYIKLK